MSWCEDYEVFYCFGLACNDRLSEQLQGSFESLQSQIKDGKLQSPCRSFTEFEYSTLKSWSKARRVIGKVMAGILGFIPFPSLRQPRNQPYGLAQHFKILMHVLSDSTGSVSCYSLRDILKGCIVVNTRGT